MRFVCFCFFFLSSCSYCKENLKKQQEEEAAKQAKLLELKLQEQREKLEAKAELERHVFF